MIIQVDFMLNDFLKYIEQNRLISINDNVLLAVSGGIDSMVMADLFFRAGIKAGIIHCNFCLRGNDSDMDEETVRKLAKDHNVPFLFKRFRTKAYSKKMGISIQMAARDLRYEYFEEARQKEGYNSVAVAHNLNDNIETLLINLTRGTGIAGLSGMKPSSNRIIRPLLFATRQLIEEYCTHYEIVYREDKSNSETKYTRNKIRHLILPVLKEINPSVEIALNDTAERLRCTNEIVTMYIEEIREKLFKKQYGNIKLKISGIQQFLHNETMLFELFRPSGITNGTLHDLYNIIKGKTGGQIFTRTHRIIKNRDEIIISEISDHQNPVIKINSIQDLKKVPLIKSAINRNLPSGFPIPSDVSTACIDFQKITFPMQIRKWEPGDFFYPLGMNRKKKLSDYLTDRKLSRLEKEKIMVLESAGQVIWIIGERIDNRFRITESTRKALIIKAQD